MPRFGFLVLMDHIRENHSGNEGTTENIPNSAELDSFIKDGRWRHYFVENPAPSASDIAEQILSAMSAVSVEDTHTTTTTGANEEGVGSSTIEELPAENVD